jgi:hypothetical protein
MPMLQSFVRRSVLAAAAAGLAVGLAAPALAQDGPVKIGGTLGLTGTLSEASSDYKAVYDLWLNR